MTRAETAALGRQWARERFATGSDWGAFLLDDALPTVGGDEVLAHEVCCAAREHWLTLRSEGGK